MTAAATFDGPNFVGWVPRECGEHRTVGEHRAWCYECGEWCYSRTIDMGCKGCEIVALRATVARVEALRDRLAASTEVVGAKVLAIDVSRALREETT